MTQDRQAPGPSDAGADPDEARDAAPEGPVIRDHRKVDPATGQPRVSASGKGGGKADAARPAGGAHRKDPADMSDVELAAAALEEADQQRADKETALADDVVAAAELIATQAELAERTDDLARVQAEYANYRRRVERDSALAGANGRAEVLTALIGVLDDIDAARAAGELTGPFGAVAEKLEAAVERFGMERYGAEGEAFDPVVHEALMHTVAEGVDGPTVGMVLQPGYRVGERVLRPARVQVLDAG